MLGTIPLTNQTDVLKIHHFTTSYLWSLTYSATNEQSQNSKSSSNTSSYVQIHGTASANEFDSGVFSQKNSSTGLNLSSFSLSRSDVDMQRKAAGEIDGYSSSVGGTSRYGNTDCGVFKRGGAKLERFLHKNQHTQRKLLNFEFWINGELSKIGHHFSDKVI